MGQLKQPVSTQAHRVRRALAGWRLVPVAIGTTAVLAGCGAAEHSAPRAAADHSAPRAAVAPAHEHVAITRASATGRTPKGSHVTVRHPSAKRAPRKAVSSTHQHPAVSQAAVTGQTGPGPQVAIAPSPATHPAPNLRTATPRPGATIRTITGTSNAQIGTLAESTSVFLVWTASEGPIQIFTSQGNLLLSSHARSGRIRLAPGRYGDLRVASAGAWTLRLHAAA